VVLVVVIVIAAIGYFVFLKPKGAGKQLSMDEQKQMMEKSQQGMQEMMKQKGGAGGMGGAPGGGMPGGK